MKIIVDIMSGDHAPRETLLGAIQAKRELGAELVLVGRQQDIEEIAAQEQLDLREVEVVHADGVITMEDDPFSVTRTKKDSSMAVGLRLLAEGRGDAFVSAGNTGALFTGATLLVRKLKGLQRAGIGSILPLQNRFLLLDCGANVTVTEDNLEQFAIMGAAYMKRVFGLEAPRVGLLNNGAEAHKGTELQQKAYHLLSQNSELNFVGNVEGNAVAFDACDVLVCDGYTGNILLKSIEGAGKFMLGKLKEVFTSSTVSKLSYLGVKKPLSKMKKDLDSSEHGGSPILGISKPVIKAHGSSNAKAFKNAIRQAMAFAESGVTEELQAVIAENAALKKSLRESNKNKDTNETDSAK